MDKINFTKLNSANVTVENTVNETIVYDIKAKANINNEELTSLDNGVVAKDGVNVATFNMWGNSFNPSFQGVTDATEMCAILMAITSFIADVKEALVNEPINI